MSPKLIHTILAAQKNEITEYYVYLHLARLTKDENNAKVLREIAEAEKSHASFWQTKTNVKVRPNWFKVFLRVLIARIFGLTFVLKLMERNEGTGSKLYQTLSENLPEAKKISEDEAIHEASLLKMLDEERLRYIGSIVLGLNDALVELTGALAGFTLALENTRLISIAGLVTGISAALSMAASDYLASKAEGDVTAGRSALYTGVTYFITVILMILPFLLLKNKFISLSLTLSIVIFIIFLFNFYLSVAKDLNFKKRFFEMAFISLGVATFSFFLGWALKVFIGVDVE